MLRTLKKKQNDIAKEESLEHIFLQKWYCANGKYGNASTQTFKGENCPAREQKEGTFQEGRMYKFLSLDMKSQGLPPMITVPTI